MKKILIITTLTAIILGGIYLALQKPQENLQPNEPVGATEKFFGGSTYTLAGSGISSSATSITLTSLTIPQNDYPIQDSDLSDTFYMTIEPGSNTRQEFISCTTVGTNTGGAVTLSGCTRGLSPISPYTASTTLQFSHAGGSKLIFSNSPNFYDQATFKVNDETITGRWYFSTELPYSPLVATTSNQFVTKTYADNIANQGAATSTETNGGIVELGTQIEMASSTNGGANKPLVLQTQYATSTPDGTSQAGLYVPVSKNNGKLHQLWLDLTEAFTWTGHHIFSSIFATNASTTNATTTNQTITGVTSSILKTDSNGLVTPAVAGTDFERRYVLISNTDFGDAGEDTFATSSPIVIPGGLLSASSTIEVKIKSSSCLVAGAVSKDCAVRLVANNGTTIASVTVGKDDNSSVGYGGTGELVVGSNNSSNFTSQITSGYGIYAQGTTPTTYSVHSPEATSNVDFTSDVTLRLVAGGTTSGRFTIENYSIIVSP